MTDSEHGAGRPADPAAAHLPGLDPVVGQDEAVPALQAAMDGAAAEEARHRRVMASAKRVMRKHRSVFAALAK